MNVCPLAIEWKEHSILFEDIKRENSSQCFFYWCTIYDNGYEMTRLCVWCESFHFCKEKQNGKKLKSSWYLSFVIIKTNLTELDRNIVPLLCSWNKVAHFKDNRVSKFVASLYFIPTAFIVILLCVCVCMCMSVCVSLCVFVCVSASVYILPQQKTFPV